MARSKHRDDDDDRNLDEPEEDAAEDETDVDTPADEDAAAADEPAADEPAADELAADEPPKEPEDEDEEDVELPPRPRTPVFTIVLLILNFLAVPPFLILLVMDYAARQQWSHAAFMNQLGALGLPFADEEDAAPAAYLNRPRLRIDSDVLKAIYSKRPKTPGTPNINEPFVPVDTIDEPVALRIRPSQIDDRVKRELFQGVGTPVGTLNDEVARLKGDVSSKIEAAVTQYVADQKDKKAAAEHLLLPMAWSANQVDELQMRIDEASKDPAKLDELLKDVAERRMLADVLAPLNIYRPDEGVTLEDLPNKEKKEKGEYKKFIVEKVANIDDYSIQDLRELLTKRFDDALRAQSDIDRRHQIAFLMVTLSQLKAPDAKTPLIDKLFERAQVVCGLYEFTQAAANYPRTLNVLRDRVVYAIEVDRDGYLAKGPTTVIGFRNNLGASIERLRKVKADIDFTVKRIQHLEAQRDRYEKEYNERLTLVTEVTKKLVTARTETARQREELNQLQQELFEAQTYLSDAADRNAELERQIRAAEKELLPKGVKTR